MEYAILAPIVGVIALIFVYYLSNKINRMDAGTDRMKEISTYIEEGAMAFLTREYKAIFIFIVALFIILAITPVLGWKTAISFLLGALFSLAAGFFGMKVATRANV